MGLSSAVQTHDGPPRAPISSDQCSRAAPYAAALLDPIYNRMREIGRTRTKIHTDDTQLPILAYRHLSDAFRHRIHSELTAHARLQAKSYVTFNLRHRR
ncbi:hypothetical protein EOA75_26015 [Mesorhizobium sp. M1A.F.Ca.IN.022.07.1.1]|uniref:IS66 family transposase n=1 Tax=unclassified Mesorhizobium TaxID=325217 RepID=UPI000FCA9B2C|nr:hypothetical protein EOA75_26015 [Mesorhizobium sp. M1A.F.Ca.IN.022.07.1.1]RWM64890.1 MAG: hypothetical protein EOR82_31700 [Mesorhizobium sp.]RWM89068.1 MAG: hypothetical protein EOR86_30070 [Mesorhizobium sp.]TJV54504.1 MAG: hypothetical protein E5X82_31545 [Mesorhizobium sp.]